MIDKFFFEYLIRANIHANSGDEMNLQINLIKSNEIITPGYQQMYNEENQIVLLLIVTGSLNIKYRKNTEHMNQGDIVFGGGFELYNSTTEIASVCGFVFSKKMGHEFCKQTMVFKSNHALYTEMQSSISLIFRDTNDSYKLWSSAERSLPEFIELLKRMVTTNPHRAEKALTGLIDSRLIMINRYIRANYEKPLTLQSLAELIHCNPTYLSNTYSKVFNISPIKYLQKIRMNKAKELLRDSNETIGIISSRLGYISSSQFTELFKRVHGVTPTHFRVNHNLTELKSKQLIRSHGDFD